MAQPSKFSGALAALHGKSVPPEEPEQLEPTPPPVPSSVPQLAREPMPAKGRGRPPGKRSDPDFKPTNLLLRKTTARIATRLLEDKGSDQDLSELVEHLLTQWVKRGG